MLYPTQCLIAPLRLAKSDWGKEHSQDWFHWSECCIHRHSALLPVHREIELLSLFVHSVMGLVMTPTFPVKAPANIRGTKHSSKTAVQHDMGLKRVISKGDKLCRMHCLWFWIATSPTAQWPGSYDSTWHNAQHLQRRRLTWCGSDYVM